MANIKLRNFKGLYTNIDESDADQEFLREAVNIKIRPGQLMSESYDIAELKYDKVKYVEDDEEVLHFEVVYIDNDKNTNKQVDNKLVSDYVRDLKPYHLVIVYGTETKIKLFRDQELVYVTPSKKYPKFKNIKVVNSDGTVKILANDTVYLLSKVSRLRYPQLDQKERITILEISVDLMPTQIVTVQNHNLKTGDIVEIKNWDGTYGRVYGKSLNGEWKVTVVNEQKFTVDNHITSSVSNGYFEIVKSGSLTYNSGFNFEELIPNDFNLKVTADYQTTGFLLNDPVKVEFLGTNRIPGTSDYKTFTASDDRIIKRTLPCWEYQFSILNTDGSLKGIDLSSIPKISEPVEWWPDKEGIKIGRMVFPLSAEYNYSGDRGLIVKQEFFTKFFDMKSSGDAEYINDPKVLVSETDSSKWLTLYGDYYLINPLALALPGNLTYKGEQSVSEVGFVNSTSKAFIVGTCIYDYQDEVVCFSKDFSISTIYQRFGVTVNLAESEVAKLPKRVTGIAFYIKTVLADDYQQFKYIDLCFGTVPAFSFFGNSLSPNGIFLNQTIGTMYDRDRYKLIRSVQDYKVISGIPFIISDGNLIAGAIGSGNAMNIFYQQNIVPDVSDLNLTQIVDVNGTLGAADESSLNLITVTNTDGVLLFSKKDSLSYGISSPNHIVELPEGTIIYTKQGIFVTNGYDKKLISEPINDIVEAGFDKGYVAYDSVNEELYFSNGERLFRYSSLYNYWSEMGVVPKGMLRVSDSGEMVFADKNKLYRFAVGKGTGKVKTMKMDLGAPDVLKTFRSIVFDFDGSVSFNEEVWDWTNKEWTIKKRTLTSKGRSMIVKSFHISNRPSIRLELEFEFTGTVYGVSLNYDLVGEVEESKIYSNI